MPRRFTPASYHSIRRRIKAERSIARNRLPGGFVVLFRAFRALFSHWEVYGGILLVYAILDIALIGGFSSSDLSSTSQDVSNIFTGNFNKLSSSIAVLGSLLSSGSTVASGVASAYQTVLLVVVSLAVVWALRQFYAGNTVLVRDAFYNATYPLVIVLLVLMILFLQLLPAAGGLFLFNAIVTGGLITVVWQQVLVGLGAALLLLWTLYMLCASVFALYIATLPNMTPLKALHSAKEIVRHRRGIVLRKLLFLPFILLIVAAIIMVPVSAVLSIIAAPIWLILSIMVVPIIHAYMYTLYRELIAE